MKDQKTNKKISLKKITIAHLSEKEIGHIYGGVESFGCISLFPGCNPPPPDDVF